MVYSVLSSDEECGTQPSRIEIWLGLLLVSLRFAFCCYRAATQSVTIDEAITFGSFVDGPWSRVYSHFDANNHILHTILVRVVVKAFGLSEFSLRLPSVIGGLFLIIGCSYLLCTVRSRALKWTAFAAICSHPLLLDFSIAARGYSLSLAFFVWAMYFAFKKHGLLSGLLLGAAVSANLSIVFPALALLSALLILTVGNLRTRLNMVRAILVPAFVVFALICSASLMRAHRGDFYLGYPTFRLALVDFVFTSIHAKIAEAGLFGSEEVATILALRFLPVLGCIAVFCWISEIRRGNVLDRLVPLATLFITILGLILAHVLFGLKYPADRTCLYFVFLSALSWGLAGDAIKKRGLRIVWLLVGGIFVVQFATQIQSRYFQFWTVEADDKQIAKIVSNLGAGRADFSMRVSTSWIHQPSLEFYRKLLHIRALRPVIREDEVLLNGSDLYVVSGEDRTRMEHSPALKPVFSDSLVGVTVLEPVAGPIAPQWRAGRDGAGRDGRDRP